MILFWICFNTFEFVITTKVDLNINVLFSGQFFNHSQIYNPIVVNFRLLT